MNTHVNGAFFLGLFAPAVAAYLLHKADRLNPLCPVCDASVIHRAAQCSSCGVGLGW